VSAQDRGALRRELVASSRDAHATGRLRQGAAIVGGLASGALLLGQLPVTIALVGLTGALVAVAWWRRGTRDVERARAPAADGLWIHENGLALRQDGAEQWVPWGGVQRITIDEEILVVRLERGALPTVTIEPRYADIAIDELAGTLAEAAGRPGPYDGSQSRSDDLQ